MQSMWRDELPRRLQPFSFLLFSSKPYRLKLLGAVICVLFASLATSLTAYTFKIIVDAAQIATTGGPLDMLWIGAFMYIGISLAERILWAGSGFFGMRWATGVRATSRYALTSYVTKHSYAYFANRFAGSISSKITQAANSTKDIGEQMLWQFLPFFITITSSLVLAFITSPLIALIFLAWVCIITPLNIYLVRWGVPRSVATQRAETALVGTTVDSMTNIHAVQEYARRSYELERLKQFIVKRRTTGIENWSFREYVRLGNGVLQVIFIGGMILVATYLTTQGALTAGDIILILTIVLIMQDRLTFIGNQLNNFGDSWGQIVESLDDIAKPLEIADAPNATTLPRISGDIALKNLSFSYGGITVFEDLNLSIPAGQRVGVVGRSGAGKSTLVKLLLRHYVPDGGTIYLDGIDAAEVTRESLRNQISVVPQEPMLFHRSIRDNIAYGNPTLSEDEIILAAKEAQAHDFIVRLAEGYESLVGERGVKLSGGQRQRVVIARAFAKDAPILILDEATSSLDSESEGAVQEALLRIMKGRTVIAIAHRLSTLRAMDRIIVMDGGKIVEDGTHEELLRHGGIYAGLWNHQAGGFLVEE